MAESENPADPLSKAIKQEKEDDSTEVDAPTSTTVGEGRTQLSPGLSLGCGSHTPLTPAGD